MRHAIAVLVIASALLLGLTSSGAAQSAGTTLTVTDRWTCAQPLSAYGELPITLISNVPNSVAQTRANGMVNLNAGCVGDGNPNTYDLCLHVNGNGTTLGSSSDAVVLRGARDINVGCAVGRVNIDCGQESSGAHQDGVAVHEGYNVTFHGADSGDWTTQTATCHGAGGVFYPSAGVSTATRIPERAVGIVCFGCRMVAKKHEPGGRALGIYESTDSGAVGSCFSGDPPLTIRLDTPSGPNRGAVRPVNVDNFFIDKDVGGDVSACSVGGGKPPPPPPPPPGYNPACAPTCDEQIAALTAERNSLTAQVASLQAAVAALQAKIEAALAALA